MPDFLDNLAWRYATKEFDISKPVSKQDLDKILYAIRMTPSSRGLQPYQIYVIDDKNLKNNLKAVASNDSQLDTCTYLLVFCAIIGRDALSERIDQYLEIAARQQNQKIAELADLKTAMQGTINKKTDKELSVWAVRQTYIALGFGLAAAASLQIDSCPMEGFQRLEVNKVLNLPDSQKSQVMLALGYRALDPKRPKVRFSDNQLFIRK